MGVVLVDAGGGTVDVAIFIEGSIWHSLVLPIGGNHLTNDIAIGLRIPFELAEELKRQHGHAVPAAVDPDDIVEVRRFGQGEGRIVSRQELATIIEARTEEIFEMILREIKRSGYDGLLPAGVVDEPRSGHRDQPPDVGPLVVASAQFVHQAQPDVLGEVLGVMDVPGKAVGEPVHPPGVLPDDLLPAGQEDGGLAQCGHGSSSLRRPNTPWRPISVATPPEENLRGWERPTPLTTGTSHGRRQGPVHRICIAPLVSSVTTARPLYTGFPGRPGICIPDTNTLHTAYLL